MGVLWHACNVISSFCPVYGVLCHVCDVHCCRVYVMVYAMCMMCAVFSVMYVTLYFQCIILSVMSAMFCVAGYLTILSCLFSAMSVIFSAMCTSYSCFSPPIFHVHPSCVHRTGIGVRDGGGQDRRGAAVPQFG